MMKFHGAGFRSVVWVLAAAIAVAPFEQTAVLLAQEHGEYAKLWNQIQKGWNGEQKAFNERLEALQNEKLSPDQLSQQTQSLVDGHMESARKYAAKLNRIYNEACRRSGVKPSVGSDPASTTGRGMAGGDVDFCGTPAQLEKFQQSLVELGVPPSELKAMQRTTSRVTVEGTLNFTVNMTPERLAVDSDEYRRRALDRAADAEVDSSIGMEKAQPGRELVGVESNIKKAQKGLYDSPGELLQNPEHLQPMVKGTLKNINLAQLTDADLKVLLKRNGITQPVEQVTEMMQKMKSQGGHLAPRELYGLDEAGVAKLQDFMRDVNSAAEWKMLQKAGRQAKIADSIARELAASNDPLIRQQIESLRQAGVDSSIRIEATMTVNHARTMELLHLSRNAKSHQVEELQKNGPSAELDKAVAELNRATELLEKTAARQEQFRRLVETRLKSIGQPPEPGSAGRGATDWLTDMKTRFLSTEVRPGIRTLSDVAGKALAGLSGIDEYNMNREAGHGRFYSAAGGTLKTGVMLTPLGIVYFAPEVSWNWAKSTADSHIRDELQRLAASGKPLTQAEASRIAQGAVIRGTLVGTTFGGAMVSQIGTLLFPLSTTAKFAGPIGMVVLAGGFAWSAYQPIKHDRDTVKWNKSQQLEQLGDAINFGRWASGVLTPLCGDIEREISALNAIVGRVENAQGLYDYYLQRFKNYRDYIEKFNNRIESIKAGLASGALNPSADGKLYAEFEAVKSDSDEISTTVDEVIADHKRGSISHEGVRQHYSELLKRYNQSQSRFLAARRVLDDLKLLSQLPSQMDGYNSARQMAEQTLFLVKNRSEQLASIGETVPSRVAALESAVEAFKTRKATSLRGLEHFLVKGGKRSEAEDRELQGMVNLLHSLTIPSYRGTTFLVAGRDLMHSADVLRALSETKLPDSVNVQGLEQYFGAAQTAVFDLTKIAADAQAALERAKRQLDRLAILVDSPPPPAVAADPPRGDSTTQAPPQGVQPPAAGARIRETSRNVFLVEMANMPRGARFIWNFGDGSGQVQTSSPQVQHGYTAPTGGLAGLAGKKWQMSVTVVDASGRIAGSASHIVSRGRLTDSPIQKSNLPPPVGRLKMPGM